MNIQLSITYILLKGIVVFASDITITRKVVAMKKNLRHNGIQLEFCTTQASSCFLTSTEKLGFKVSYFSFSKERIVPS